MVYFYLIAAGALLPILNNFDSLNVANAASIVIYESVKQTVQKSSDSV